MSSEANAIYFLALVLGRAECQMGGLGNLPSTLEYYHSP